MASQPYIPFYYQDFDFGTKNFTYAQKGIYFELLCIQWDRGFITQKHFSKIKKEISEEEFQDIFEKFVEIQSGFQNKRLEKTRQEVRHRSKIAKQNGSLGGRPPKTKLEASDNQNKSKEETKLEPKNKLSNVKSSNLQSSNIKDKIKLSLYAGAKNKKKPPLFPWPEDFNLSIQLFDYAKKQGISKPEEAFEDFRLAAQTSAYMYADWNLAFMRWCRDDRTKKKFKNQETEDYYK